MTRPPIVHLSLTCFTICNETLSELLSERFGSLIIHQIIKCIGVTYKIRLSVGREDEMGNDKTIQYIEEPYVEYLTIVINQALFTKVVKFI